MLTTRSSGNRRHGLALLVSVLITTLTLPASAGTVTGLLEKAIYTEETVGDLEEAIEIDQKVLAESENSINAAAQAQFRIGACYAKQGKTDEAAIAFQVVVDDYMTKPFGIRELLARVRALLRRRIGEVPDSIEIGGAVFDRIAHTLSRDGIEIPLTTKEYRLLDFFSIHPHRALTRKDIMNQVWGQSIIVSARSVDRCVATLRSKIELQPSRPQFIHTIRDVGYRFELPSPAEQVDYVVIYSNSSS